MKKFDVVVALEAIREARSKWAVAQTSFTADVETLMKRLLNEAAVNYMSVEEVARASGLTTKRVRSLMRENNLNPKNGRRLLAKTASETLVENAALLGVEPREFDLTSPLAYLPMGSQLREFLRNDNVDPDSILAEESHEVEHLTEVFKKAWHEADDAGMEGSRTVRGIMAVLDAQKVGAAA